MGRTSNRRNRILDLIASGEENVDVLARMFDVSTSTIRRDLAVMSEEGRITRTYGGAVLAHAQSEQTLSTREQLNGAAKEAIAIAAAAAMIEDGDSVLLDAGSTVGALGRLLPLRRITVDKVFLGADGVAAAASKLGLATQPFWALLLQRWTLITDASATDEQLQPFARSSAVHFIRA